MKKIKYLIGIPFITIISVVSGFLIYNHTHPQILKAVADYPILQFEELESRVLN